MAKIGDRASFMTATQKVRMERAPRNRDGSPHRSHENCMDATGVGRPGKTAQDRARRKEA